MPAAEALELNWIPFLHPDDRKRVLAAWDLAVKTKTKFHQEYRWVHPDQTVVWTLGEVVPVLDDQGRVTLQGTVRKQVRVFASHLRAPFARTGIANSSR